MTHGDTVTVIRTGATGVILATWHSRASGVPMIAVSVNGHTRRYYADEVTR